MKKFLIFLGAIVLIIIIAVVVAFVFVWTTSEKLVCKSKEGDITILYNDKTITGYRAYNITYDFEEQRKIAEDIGIEEYIEEFKGWFETNTSGTCE